MWLGLPGSTAIAVSFCGVRQPRLDAPLLLIGSLLMTLMSVVGAYAPGVLHGVERHRATAASGGSSSSSSPPCAHGALMLGLNLNPRSAVVADAGQAATAATAPATDSAPTMAMPQRRVRRTFPPEHWVWRRPGRRYSQFETGTTVGDSGDSL